MTELSEKYLAQELLDLQQTLGWMDLVIGNITDAVYVTDSTGRIVFANTYFSDLVEISRVFLLGQKAEEVFPIQQIEQIPFEFEDYRPAQSTHGKVHSGIYELERAGNPTLIFRVSMSPLKATDQSVFLAQEITREYQLSRMKSDFINLASHQLRTPMTAIMTYAHLLRDGHAGDLTKQQLSLAETLVHSSERMIQLVNDLLTIVRMQNETGAQGGQKTDVEKLMKKIYTELKPRIKKKKIEYSWAIPGTLQCIKGHETILHEIFSNLIVNSIQYTPDGGEIKVTAKEKSGRVIISIADTGIGIPDEVKPKLFKQFQRADNALEAYPEGTGLGLYMIKILLEKIGGSISFDSTINKGTVFCVSLVAASD